MRTTTYQLKIEGIEVDVVKKDVKNINLKIYGSNGKVRVTTPKRISKRIVRNFITEKIEWIKKHLKIIENQLSDKSLRYISGEQHFLFGEQFTLNVREAKLKPEVYIDEGDHLVMSVRPDSDQEKRERVMREWYRKELKKRIPALIEKWEKSLGVKVKEWNVKKMKTRWGTCNIHAARIWLSLELAKKPIHHLDYVVLHEVAHLIERSHNARFKGILTEKMPNWKAVQREMNNKE